MTNSFVRLLSILAVAIMLAACASSAVQRDAASNIDLGVQNAKNLASGDTNIADSYQNASQTTKGALIGGGTGAVAGAIYSGSVGVIPGLAVGALLGGSYGAYIDANTSLQDQLENRGANLIVLGDQVLVVIPSDRLFNPWTSTIKPQAHSTIALLAKYINSYTKILVKVAAYTDDTGSARVDKVLSQQQADNVSKLLTAYGLDARLLYASGFGGTHLVTTSSQDWNTDNYRIEVTLEKLYV